MLLTFDTDQFNWRWTEAQISQSVMPILVEIHAISFEEHSPHRLFFEQNKRTFSAVGWLRIFKSSNKLTSDVAIDASVVEVVEEEEEDKEDDEEDNVDVVPAVAVAAVAAVAAVVVVVVELALVIEFEFAKLLPARALGLPIFP